MFRKKYLKRIAQLEDEIKVLKTIPLNQIVERLKILEYKISGKVKE